MRTLDVFICVFDVIFLNEKGIKKGCLDFTFSADLDKAVSVSSSYDSVILYSYVNWENISLPQHRDRNMKESRTHLKQKGFFFFGS